MEQVAEIRLEMTGGRRRTYSLNGAWEICGTDRETTLQDLPRDFGNSAPVPGLADLADAPVRGAAVWYKRRLRVTGEIPENAVLKINKAWWGKRVYLNAYHMGDHQPNFTPAYMDLRTHLHGGENTLLIRLGDYNAQTVDQGQVVGYDYEKFEYTPGIYDDVTLFFCGNPMIRYLQVAPDAENERLTLQLTLVNTGAADIADRPTYCVRDAEGNAVLEGAFDPVTIHAGETIQLRTEAAFPGVHLWTPETPYLYTASAATAGDEISARFGMRTFQFDAKTKKPMLNGKIYYWRGTNITMYRFFEDPDRGLLPWDRAWAKQVLLSFKKTNMNSIRYCIGFPPELWYDLADELGFLIQDEYPTWGEVDVDTFGSGKVPHWGDRKPDVTRTLLPELIDWQNERANHPCVAIWDVQNETDTYATEILIRQMRDAGTDLSDRPYDNGWGRPAAPTDTIECHPYLFSHPGMTWNKANRADRDPAVPMAVFFNHIHSADLSLLPDNPRITNEYCWLWINRDSSPTTLTQDVYRSLIPDATPEERRAYHDQGIAKLTEFWRSSRTSACLLYFCGLTYCKLDVGRTCDEFLPDIAHPTCSETYVKYMHDAMAPLGICIDDISDLYAPGEKTFDIVLVNDLEDGWRGEIAVELNIEGRNPEKRTLQGQVEGFGRSVQALTLTIPDEPGAKGELTASYVDGTGERIYSRRRFTIGPDGGVEKQGRH